MIYSEPIDGMCPRCQVELVHHKADVEYFEGHGSYEIYPAYSACPSCDWKPYDTDITACDMCGTITNELVDHEGDEYCTKCHREQNSAKLVKLVVEAAIRVTMQTKYAAFVNYMGHIHTLDVRLSESKTEYNKEIAGSSVKLCVDWFDDITALKEIYMTLTNIAVTGKLPEKFKPYRYGADLCRIPEVMSA